MSAGSLFLVIGVCLLLTFLLSRSRHFSRRRLQPGVPIVYQMAETSSRPPGPDAKDIRPAERGDLYYFLTRKYWRVEQVLDDGRIVAVTPLMEHHLLRRDDPNLRRASLLEQLRHGARFPRLASGLPLA